MRVDVILTEADITQEFTEALEARDLPEKFFFWFPRSAAEWSALTRDSELYVGLRETWKQISSEAAELARHFGKRAPVISFGAGDGARDRLLMMALKDAGCECAYFPVDASQAMLEMACAGAEDEDIETAGIKADISSPIHLVYAADAAEPQRLFIMSGNTMGAFDPLAEIRYLSQCMKPGDRLIIDGEAYDEEKTMARRANPAARKFVRALLASVGVGEGDGEIRYDHKRDDRHAGLHIITRYFHADRDLTMIAAGEDVDLARGERIGLNFQYTYTAQAFHWLLCEQGGLKTVKQYLSPDGRFLTAMCRK
jgi:uncharacterized SAM-dependent methyltransferase